MTAQQQPPSPADAFPAGAASARPSSSHGVRPNLSGDLNSIFADGPAFSPAMRGYDRMQVDNYVAWAETELRAAHRLNSQLLTRLAASELERQRAQQLLELSDHSREAVRLTDRVAELLRGAAEEAAAVAAAGAAHAAQADDIVAAARERADLIIRRARQREAQAAAGLQAAERAHAEAEAATERARTEVRDMLSDAEERLAELVSRQDQVQTLLGALVPEVDAALSVLADEDAKEFAFGLNRADARDEDDAATPAAASLSRRSA